ncbi:MAG: response regulator, partial [Rhodocyclaceae bacterium]|nr:response regulator [Rhodocyclaceae bacterium]
MQSAVMLSENASDDVDGAAEAKPRILVVDDVADNRDILVRRLVRRNFDVAEAVGGQDALKQIAESDFDLILLDVMMPDLSGTEVLKRLRDDRRYDNMPVIMVTAKSQSEDVVESLGLGANDYITKPVDFEIAVARINTQLERKRAADAVLNEKYKLETKARALDEKLESASIELANET